MKKSATSAPSTKALLAFLNSEQRFAYATDMGQQIIDRMRASYARKYALYQAVLDAMEEGVFEITIRSATKTVTMQVAHQSGNVAAEEMYTQLAEQLGALNTLILDQLVDQENTDNDTSEDRLNRHVHSLCMPTVPVAPERAAPVEGERCPFLPASTEAVLVG